MLTQRNDSKLEQAEMFNSNSEVIRCSIHNDFEIDSICFDKKCRLNGKQLICGYCSHAQQPHCSHKDQVYPIYKTSPGFNLLELVAESSASKDIQSQCDAICSEIIKIRNEAIRLIEETTNKAQKRLKCLSAMAKSGSVFRVCQKIKRDGPQHIECCLRMVNQLKEFEQNSKKQKRSIQKRIQMFIASQIENSKEKLTSFIQNINNSISQYQNLPITQSIFQEQSSQVQNKTAKTEYIVKMIGKKKSDFQNTFKSIQKTFYDIQRSIVHQQKRNQNEQIKQESLQMNKKDQSTIQKIIIDSKSERQNEQDDIHSQNEDSPIQKLRFLQKSSVQQKSCDYRQIKDESYIKRHLGIDQINSQTISIWKNISRKVLIAFLKQRPQIKNLIFESPLKHEILDDRLIKKFINSMKNIKGISFHLIRAQMIPKQLLGLKRLQYFSICDDYSFIQRVDLVQFFRLSVIQDIQNKDFSKRIKLYNQYSNLKNVYVQSTQIKVSSSTEVIYFKDNLIKQKLFINQIFDILGKLRSIKILVLSGIDTRNICSFQIFFERNKQLHTFVLQNSRCNYLKFMEQLTFIPQNQLKHLKISALNLETTLTINLKQFQHITYHKRLQTLILLNIQFQLQAQKSPSYRQKKLKTISKLSGLTHLNLYGTQSIEMVFLTYLHPNCKKNLKMLNLGCTDIDNNSIAILSQFRNLEALCLDYTEINGKSLLEITSQMSKLIYLSIEGLNGQKMEGIGRYFGKVTQNHISKMNFKKLQFVNISLCYSLKNYYWPDFHHLQRIRISKSMKRRKIFKSLNKRNIDIVISDESYVQQFSSQNLSSIEQVKATRSSQLTINNRQSSIDINKSDSSTLTHEKNKKKQKFMKQTIDLCASFAEVSKVKIQMQQDPKY